MASSAAASAGAARRVALGNPGRDRVKDQVCGARRIRRPRCGPSGLRCPGGAQRPEELREGVLANLTSLELDQVPVVNLRRHAETDVPFDEQVAAMAAMRDEG